MYVGGAPSPFSFRIDKRSLDAEGYYVHIYYEGQYVETRYYPTPVLIERLYPKFPEIHTA